MALMLVTAHMSSHIAVSLSGEGQYWGAAVVGIMVQKMYQVSRYITVDVYW